jgi:4-amino-4-deoxy-L-arabinose transferase-like glycosyltransferase
VVVIGAENLPSSMYTPLVVLLAAYAVLAILAGRARSNDDRAQADRWANIGFAVVLVTAVYALVLLITGIFSYPSRSSDMITIIIVIGVFFALLLFVFFVISELLPHALRRGRRER